MFASLSVNASTLVFNYKRFARRPARTWHFTRCVPMAFLRLFQ